MRYLRNAWYVAAFAADIGTNPVKRTLMDEPIVLFRTESGVLAALADRCPHRFAPLSLGKVIGEHIRCPYHGLRFDSSGVCAHNPHGNHAIPGRARVRQYAVAERDGLVWLWMGDSAAADSSAILDLKDFYDREHHSIVVGSFRIKSRFELVLDNLMDLSHAPYLHAGTLSNGEDEMQTLRVELEQQGNTVIARHFVPNVPPTPQFRPFWNSSSVVGDFRAIMRWDPPCNLQLDVGITECGGSPEQGPYIHMTHMLTPISERETLYHWVAARNSAVGDEEVSRIVQANIQRAFTTEDEPMIAAVQEMMGPADLFDLKPIYLPGDAAAARARRVLMTLCDAEQGRPFSAAAEEH